MKSRQRKAHCHEARVKRKSAKQARKRNMPFNAHRGHSTALSVQQDKSYMGRSARQNPVHKSIGGNSFLQLLKTWHPPQLDRKVIPFPVFQSNRRAKAEMESVA